MSSSNKLENVALWQSATEIADYTDSLLSKFPEEEKWGMESKLRGRALDLTTDVAEAYGSIDPRDKKWLLGLARRDLFGLKNLLRMAHKREYADANPEIMVAIDKAIYDVDQELVNATKEIPKWFDEMNSPDKKDGKK